MRRRFVYWILYLISVSDWFRLTQSFSHSWSIWILCYDLRVLWPAKSTTKIHATPLGFRPLADIDRNFKCWKSKSSSLKSCKTVNSDSWRSKKIPDLLGLRLYFSRFHIVNRCSSGSPGSIPGQCKPVAWEHVWTWCRHLHVFKLGADK